MTTLKDCYLVLKQIIILMIYFYLPIVEICAQWICTGDLDLTDPLCTWSDNILAIFGVLVSVTGAILETIPYTINGVKINSVCTNTITFVSLLTCLREIDYYIGMRQVRYIYLFLSHLILGYLSISWIYHNNINALTVTG